MPEFSYDDFDVKKRKGRERTNQINSKIGEWDCSLPSAPNRKKKKIEVEWMSVGSEEVGDSDDLHYLGRELFEQTTSSGPGKVKNELVQFCEEDMVADSRAPVNVEGNHAKYDTSNGIDVGCFPKAEKKGPVNSLNATRSYMEKILGELKEARGRLLQWMRQEVHNILCEQSVSPGVRMSFAGQNGVEMESEEGSHHLPLAARLLNSGPVRSQFGGQGSVDSRVGFTGQGTGGQVSYRGHHGGGGSNLGKNSYSGRKDIIRSKYKVSTEGIGTALSGQNNAHIDKVFGASSTKFMDFREQSRETPGLVVGLQDGKVGFVGFGSQNGGDGVVGFPIQPDLQGDTRLGAQAGGSGGIRFGVQNNGGGAMIFGEQGTESVRNGVRERVADVRSSVGQGNTNPSSNGVGINQGSSLGTSADERTTDLMGMQNQNSVGMQNPVAFNMVWSMMQQSGRNGNYPVLDSRVPIYNHEAHGKILNRGMSGYTGIIGNSSGFENSGMMNSAVVQNANVALGVQLPLSAQSSSPSLSSSGVPILVGMQTQAAVHNSSSMQNFLGLSMNGLAVGGSANRQVFQGVYLQENAHNSMPSGKGTPLTTSPLLHAVADTRGHGMQGMDILELNT